MIGQVMGTRNPDGLGDALPALPGDGVLLRSLAPSDADAVLELFGDTDVVRFMALPRLHTREDAQALIAAIHEGFGRGTLYQWGIERDGLVAGTCTLAEIDRRHRRAALGFAVMRRRWGQRIASRALPAVLAFAFERLDLHRIEADVDPRNEPSLRVLRRLGFRREGLMRERYRRGREVQDAIVFGLLRPEWEERAR